jgi:16S rRNA (uracil1498-N3)-methyltransferase
MSVTRLFVSNALQGGSQLRLDDDRAHYLGRVLRLRVGDALTVFNGEDGEFEASIVEFRKNSATLTIGRQRASDTESPFHIHLVQGISRGERMDFVVQKATELGVKRITPVLTAYGVVKLDAGRATKRRDHWRRIAESACEQSARVRPPLVDEPVPLHAWLGSKPARPGTDLVLRPQAQQPLARIARPETKLCLLIGPEGGLSDAEYGDAEAAGFQAVSVGPRTLRTETAAVAALAIAQSSWGDLS